MSIGHDFFQIPRTVAVLLNSMGLEQCNFVLRLDCKTGLFPCKKREELGNSREYITGTNNI